MMYREGMKKHVVHCFFMVVWILVLTSYCAAESHDHGDHTDEVIPEDIVIYLLNKLPDWNIPKVKNFTPYWKMFLGQHALAPFFVKGDFDGDGNHDVALLLEKDARLSLIVLHKREKTYQHIWIAKEVVEYSMPNIDGKRIKVFDAGIGLEPPGKIKGFAEGAHGENLEPTLELRYDGIHLYHFETTSDLYYWDGNEYQSFHTSD